MKNIKPLTLLAFMFAISACEKPSYKEQLTNAKYKVGDTILVDRGFYNGCKLTVEEVVPTPIGLKYLGKSECDIIGVTE